MHMWGSALEWGAEVREDRKRKGAGLQSAADGCPSDRVQAQA